MNRQMKVLGCILVLSTSSLMGALPDWIGYITNTGSPIVTTVNLSTNVSGSDAVLTLPGQNVAISNDANTAYVTSADANNTILTPIDINTNTVGTAIPVVNTGGAAVGTICMTPDGTRAYVLAPDNGVNGSVTPVDLLANTAGTPIPLTPNAGSIGMAITPDGTRAYVCNRFTSELVPIDLTTNIALSAIPLSLAPQSIAITPDGTTAYIVMMSSNSVVPFTLPAGPEGTPIPVGSNPNPIAITPDGKKAYVSNSGGNTVTPIDLVTNTPGTPINIGNIALGLAISPDGAKLYIPIVLGAMTLILDIATDTLDSQTIPGGTPFQMAITPDQAPVAAFTMVSNGVFDASASSSLVGSIASYAWDFGDGQTLITNSPIVNHVYSSPGNYIVTLQVTNTAGTSTEYVTTGRTALQNGGPSAVVTHQVTITPSGPTSPTNFKGDTKKNRFLTQTDFFNRLRWTPSSDASVAGYNLYRNGTLIAIIPANGPYHYQDHNRKKGVTYIYTLVAFDSSGEQSSVSEVVLTP